MFEPKKDPIRFCMHMDFRNEMADSMMETETCAPKSCEAATESCEAAVQYIQNSMEYETKFSSAIVMTMSDAVVPQKLIDLNKVDGVYLAGGALTRFVMNTEFDLPPFSENRVAKHDLDFFVVGLTQEIREERMREFLTLVGGKVSRSNMHMADVVQEDGCRIQVIMTNYETIQKVVTHFDFSLSRFWLAPNNEIKATSSAFMSIRDKINVVTTKHQSVSRARIEKYQRLFQLKTVVDNEDKLVDGENVVTTEEVDMACAFTPLPKTYKNYYGVPHFKFVSATHCVIETPENGRVIAKLPMSLNESILIPLLVNADTELYLNKQPVEVLPKGHYDCSATYNSATFECYKLWLRGNGKTWLENVADSCKNLAGLVTQKEDSDDMQEVSVST